MTGHLNPVDSICRNKILQIQICGKLQLFLKTAKIIPKTPQLPRRGLQLFLNARLMCTPELKFKEKMTTYPSDQSRAQFTKVFEIKSTNPRIKFAADEEIIDGISWKGEVLMQTVRQIGGLQKALLSTVRGPRQPLGVQQVAARAGVPVRTGREDPSGSSEASRARAPDFKGTGAFLKCRLTIF